MPEIVQEPGWGDSWGQNWGGQNVIKTSKPYQYWIEVITGTGERTFIDEIKSLSVKRRQTAISDWSATVAHRPVLASRTLSGVRVFWGDSVLFHGRLEGFSGDINSPTVKISGRGAEADLTRGEIAPPVNGLERWEAIRLLWDQYTPFSATVTKPADPSHPGRLTISGKPLEKGGDSEYAGTPMRILKKLHTEGDMLFTILHAQSGLHAQSYPPGTHREKPDWNVLDGDRDVSAADYANVVIVTGGEREDGDGRYRGVAEDDDEIATLRKRGIGEQGRVVYPIDDPSIGPDDDMSKPGAQTGDQKCHSKAKGKLQKLVQKESVGGSLDITPTVAEPGHTYYIADFSESPFRTFGEGVFGEGTFGIDTGVYATLNSIEYSIERGDESCSVDLSRQPGFADTLDKAYGDGET